METENKTFREPGIDVLKGICILFIIITHYGWSETQRLKFLFPFWIDLAVPIFMVISGYVNARTFESREVKDYSTALQLKNIKRPFLRYTVPYLVVLIVEIAIWGGRETLWTNLCTLVTGGQGPGSYYYPILFQFIFVFPCVYFLIKDNPQYGLIFFLFVNIIFEIVCSVLEVDSNLYRLSLGRFIWFIALGCYLHFELSNLKSNDMKKSFILGIFWILFICYSGYKTKIINNDWKGRAFPVGLYVAPIVSWWINNLRGLQLVPLVIMGKASYHIFLIQMFYYNFRSEIYSYIDGTLLRLSINIMVCVGGGILFYYLFEGLKKIRR